MPSHLKPDEIASPTTTDNGTPTCRSILPCLLADATSGTDYDPGRVPDPKALCPAHHLVPVAGAPTRRRVQDQRLSDPEQTAEEDESPGSAWNFDTYGRARWRR